MARLFLRALFFLALASALAACGARPRPVDDIPRAMEIRAVVVTAAADVARPVLRNTRNQLDKAIRDTVRPVPLPRAVMQVHISGIQQGRAYDGVTAQIQVNVILADVENGMVILDRPFALQAFAFNQRGLNNAIVEAIVSRLRVEYGLSQPLLRPLPEKRQRISTRMQSDEPVLAKHQEVAPVVVPLKRLQRIGTDADPVLNSRTKVEPVAKPAKAVVMPEAKTEQVPAENALESGANAKVTITPKAAKAEPAAGDPASSEPCVETMDKKC